MKGSPFFCNAEAAPVWHILEKVSEAVIVDLKARDPNLPVRACAILKTLKYLNQNPESDDKNLHRQDVLTSSCNVDDKLQ